LSTPGCVWGVTGPRRRRMLLCVALAALSANGESCSAVSSARELELVARVKALELELAALRAAPVGTTNNQSFPDLTAAFRAHARSQPHVSDKVVTHRYESMYGPLLAPLRARTRLKMLEIGLGCNMGYGPGASVQLWRSYFADVGSFELWMAEYDAACAEKFRRSHGDAYHTLVGDQGDAATVRRWVEESGPGVPFDVVVDDGSHRNADILTSFRVLWPHLAPGGVYFVEDLQVGRSAGFQGAGARADDNSSASSAAAAPPPPAAAVADVVHDWLEQLLIDPRVHRSPDGRVVAAGYRGGDPSQRHPLPEGLKFIFCVDEGCAFGKQPHHDTRPNDGYFFVRPLGCWAEAPGAAEQQQARVVPALEGLDVRLDGAAYAERADAVQKCAEAAKARGFDVFVVQDGGWCGASADAPHAYRRHGRSTACALDGKGGRNANAAYELLSERPPPDKETAWFEAAVAGAHAAAESGASAP